MVGNKKLSGRADRGRPKQPPFFGTNRAASCRFLRSALTQRPIRQGEGSISDLHPIGASDRSGAIFMKSTSGSGAAQSAEKGKYKVLIVDDHPITRFGVGVLINQQRDMIVCGEAEGPSGAAGLVEKLAPDLAILDLAHGTMGGIELIRNIKVLRPKMQVLVMSMQDEDIYAERALRAGATGYIMKREPVGNILTAIRRVLSGELHLSEKMKERMLHRVVKSSKGARSFPRLIR